jgi:hypothetical protein
MLGDRGRTNRRGIETMEYSSVDMSREIRETELIGMH